MANSFIGKDGVARSFEKIYIGATTQVPIYETSQIIITADNIGSVFDVTNGTYYFVGNGGTFATNNAGVSSSEAQTTLMAKQDCDISFNYSFSTETNYDKFYLTVAGTTIENAASGENTSKSYSGSLNLGDTIIFKYTKDSSVNSGDDQCTFFNMTVTTNIQTGIEYKDLAWQVGGGGSTQAPTISVSSSGLITATSGDQSTTKYLSTSDDSDFKASNIKSGVNIFGVTGSYSGAKTEYIGDATASGTQITIPLSDTSASTLLNLSLRMSGSCGDVYLGYNTFHGISYLRWDWVNFDDVNSAGLEDINLSYTLSGGELIITCPETILSVYSNNGIFGNVTYS